VSKEEKKEKKIIEHDDAVIVLRGKNREELMAQRDHVFYELQDAEGKVTLRCPKTGLSRVFNNIDQFPLYNAKTPTKSQLTYFVKYVLE